MRRGSWDINGVNLKAVQGLDGKGYIPPLSLARGIVKIYSPGRGTTDQAGHCHVMSDR